MEWLKAEDRQVAERLAEFVAVTPQVTNAQMRAWLQTHHNVPAQSVRADDIVTAVRDNYYDRRAPVTSRETRHSEQVAALRAQGHDAATARILSRMYR